jgi:hypothetical protein
MPRAKKSKPVEIINPAAAVGENANDRHDEIIGEDNNGYDAVDIARAAAHEPLDGPVDALVPAAKADDDEFGASQPHSQVEGSNADPEAIYLAAVEEGKAIVATISGKQWALGDLADTVVTKYGEARLEQFAEDINFDGVYTTLERYRTVCRAFPKTRGRPRYFASAQVLAPYTQRFEIVERNPDISEREARAILLRWRDEQDRVDAANADEEDAGQEENEQDEREPQQPAAAEANLTEATVSEESATPPIVTEEAQSPETESDEGEGDYDDDGDDQGDYDDEGDYDDDGDDGGYDDDGDDGDDGRPDAGSVERHAERWWAGLLVLENKAANYSLTPEYVPNDVMRTVVQRTKERLPGLEKRFEAVLATIRLLKQLCEEPGAAAE